MIVAPAYGHPDEGACPRCGDVLRDTADGPRCEEHGDWSGLCLDCGEYCDDEHGCTRCGAVEDLRRAP